jgi:DNA (cytosine-5)-methyltransferase 1
MHQSLLAQSELGIEEIPSDRSSWFESLIELLGVDQNSGWPDRFGQALQKYIRTKSRKKVRVLSLFSGGGGLDIAFHDAGFDIVECNELEAAFCKTLQKNVEDDGYLSGSSVLCKDIRNYTPQVKNIDFIIGGPPCQTFSAAGARAAGVNGMDDDRGNLFREYARILDQLKPQGFLFENVYRIVGAQEGRAWSSVQEAFKSLGYTLHWKILDAADYGVPQKRKRFRFSGLPTLSSTPSQRQYKFNNNGNTTLQ